MDLGLKRRRARWYFGLLLLISLVSVVVKLGALIALLQVAPELRRAGNPWESTVVTLGLMAALASCFGIYGPQIVLLLWSCPKCHKQLTPDDWTRRCPYCKAQLTPRTRPARKPKREVLPENMPRASRRTRRLQKQSFKKSS